jgi:hypothetical protein
MAEETKAELLEEAKAKHVEVPKSATKAEIVEALEEAEPVGTRRVTGGLESVTLNPDEQRPASADDVVGSGEGDDGDLEFTPEAFAGVSQDRWLEPATIHGYPVETDEDREAAAARQAEIDEANAKREEQRAENDKATEEAARRRLADLLGK